MDRRVVLLAIAIAWAQTILCATIALAGFCGLVWMLAMWVR